MKPLRYLTKDGEQKDFPLWIRNDLSIIKNGRKVGSMEGKARQIGREFNSGVLIIKTDSGKTIKTTTTWLAWIKMLGNRKKQDEYMNENEGKHSSFFWTCKTIQEIQGCQTKDGKLEVVQRMNDEWVMNFEYEVLQNRLISEANNRQGVEQ